MTPTKKLMALATAVPGVVLGCALMLGWQVSAQTPRLKMVMRGKLDHSKNILEAAVTSNWSQMAREASALQQLTNDPAWVVLKMPEYVLERDQFLKAIEAVSAAASRRDLEEASTAIAALSTSCISCHQYLARTRVAK
ncbi:MAG: hypothetical protein AB7I13_18510 [Vicinamibacterales bacterium]